MQRVHGKLEIGVEASAAAIEEVQAWKKKIEDIIAEFGDQPRTCFAIIDEHFNGKREIEY